MANQEPRPLSEVLGVPSVDDDELLDVVPGRMKGNVRAQPSSHIPMFTLFTLGNWAHIEIIFDTLGAIRR
jgi:hypothetical protein